jgi:polysaccharide pyruvyl transferase WcaK-like protein
MIPWAMSELYWNQVWLNKPVFIHGIGIPTWKQPQEIYLAFYKEFLSHKNVKWVNFRDVESLTYCEKRCTDTLPFPSFSPDVVFSHPRIPLYSKKNFPTEFKRMGVALRYRKGDDIESYKALSEELHGLQSNGVDLRFFVLATHESKVGKSDSLFIKQFMEHYGFDCEVVYPKSYDEIFTSLAECDGLVSMKFHGALVALMLGVYPISINATTKTRNLYSMLDMQDRTTSLSSPEKITRICQSI